MKQLISSEDCEKCRDKCCEYSRAYENSAPVISDSHMKRLVGKGIAKNSFRRKGKGWMIRLESGAFSSKCPFYVDIKKKRVCLIYQDRPFECMIFPFVVMRRSGRTVLGLYNKDTNCHVTRRMEGSRKFDDYIRSLKNHLESDNVRKMLRECPEIIMPDQHDAVTVAKLSI